MTRSSNSWSGLTVTALESVGKNAYASLVACVGYESRARYIASQLESTTNNVWAADYATNQVFSYGANRDYFSTRNGLIEVSDGDYRKRLRDDMTIVLDDWRSAHAVVGTGGSPTGVPRVAVDISSMDRDRLTMTAFALLVDQSGPLEVDFLYAPAEFDESLVGSAGTVLVNRPAYGLEGWTADPSLPLTCILGTGFELELALAALETLEPARTVIFVPRGEDARYDEVVDKRNAEIGVLHGDEVPYSVINPYRLMRDLESICHSYLSDSRVVIVPLGPKVFALASILTGIGYSQGRGGGELTVWRMSADYGRHPEDRAPTGSIVGLTVRVN